MGISGLRRLSGCGHVARFVVGACVVAATFMALQPALAADHYFVYVGPYTEHGSKGIYQYRFDEKDGKMTAVGLAAQIANPSFLATDARNRYLYALGAPTAEEGQPRARGGSASSFSIDARTGTLTYLNSVPAGGRGPAHLTLDNTGKILFVANYGDGSVTSFAIAEDGSIGGMTSKDQHQGSSIDPARQKGPHAHMVDVSPDNRFLFVPDLGLDKIFIYKIDEAKHGFVPNVPAYVTVKAGLGPRHFTFSPDARFAYAVCEMGSSVVAFSYDAVRGSLTPIQTISILPPGFTEVDQGSEIQIAPSGRYLYASNQGPEGNSSAVDGRITVFQVDRKTGLLKQLQTAPSNGKEVRSFVLDPTGRYLLAGNGNSNTVTVFKVAADGKIDRTGQMVEIGSPASLLFVPTP